MASDRENWNARYGFHAVKAGIKSPGIFPDEVACRIADAIAIERERCAKLVEQMAAETPGPQGPDIKVLIDADNIAAKIRSGL